MNQRLLPPTLTGLLVLITVPLGIVVPGSNRLAWPWRATGLVVLIAGILVANAAHTLFARLGTNIDTFGEPDVMVTSGLFAVTRNPMYVGLALVLAGVALIIGSISAWLGPVGFVLAANRWYIPFEEERMRDRFGTEYHQYQAAIPRWIGLPRKRHGN